MKINDDLLSNSRMNLLAGSRLVVKLGGSVLQDDSLLDSICADLAQIRNAGIHPVIVHGGGPSINEELTRRGITWEFVNGLRVTTPEMIDVIEMVLCGGVNRRIVRALNKNGLLATGFSGADASLLMCHQADERLGRVGAIETVNLGVIEAAMSMRDARGLRAIPVIAPIGVGRDGLAYNINADWAASKIATAMGVEKLIFLTDQTGILNSKGELLGDLQAVDLQALILDGTVKGGMLAKTQTILHAIQNGVERVHVLNARSAHILSAEVLLDRRVGTLCRLRSHELGPIEDAVSCVET